MDDKFEWEDEFFEHWDRWFFRTFESEMWRTSPKRFDQLVYFTTFTQSLHSAACNLRTPLSSLLVKFAQFFAKFDCFWTPLKKWCYLDQHVVAIKIVVGSFLYDTHRFNCSVGSMSFILFAWSHYSFFQPRTKRALEYVWLKNNTYLFDVYKMHVPFSKELYPQIFSFFYGSVPFQQFNKGPIENYLNWIKLLIYLIQL